MKVSVIISTLNSSKTVEATLQSIVVQNYDDLQVLVQDGGSVDNTKNIVELFPFALAGWQSEPDNGIYDAMNKGIQRAEGELIAILNSDDTWLPGTLSRVTSLFSRNPNVGLVSGAIEVWEDSAHGAKIVLKSSLSHMHKGMSIQHPATFVRRNVYETVGHFNTRYRVGADYDFLFRCLKANIACIIVDDIFTRMRVGGKGGTTFCFDDWKIRRAYNISSVFDEILIYTNRIIRYVLKYILIKTFGGAALSIIRKYLWKKRVYR